MNKAVFSLKAIYAPQNVRRYYIVRVGQNLFKEWEISVSYGRIGSLGQGKLYTFSALEEALHKLKEVLHKRFTSTKRIGVSYSLYDMSVEESFKESFSNFSERNFLRQVS